MPGGAANTAGNHGEDMPGATQARPRAWRDEDGAPPCSGINAFLEAWGDGDLTRPAVGAGDEPGITVGRPAPGPGPGRGRGPARPGMLSATAASQPSEQDGPRWQAPACAELQRLQRHGGTAARATGPLRAPVRRRAVAEFEPWPFEPWPVLSGAGRPGRTGPTSRPTGRVLAGSGQRVARGWRSSRGGPPFGPRLRRQPPPPGSSGLHTGHSRAIAALLPRQRTPLPGGQRFQPQQRSAGRSLRGPSRPQKPRATRLLRSGWARRWHALASLAGFQASSGVPGRGARCVVAGAVVTCDGLGEPTRRRRSDAGMVHPTVRDGRALGGSGSSKGADRRGRGGAGAGVGSGGVEPPDGSGAAGPVGAGRADPGARGCTAGPGWCRPRPGWRSPGCRICRGGPPTPPRPRACGQCGAAGVGGGQPGVVWICERRWSASAAAKVGAGIARMVRSRFRAADRPGSSGRCTPSRSS